MLFMSLSPKLLSTTLSLMLEFAQIYFLWCILSFFISLGVFELLLMFTITQISRQQISVLGASVYRVD